MSTSILDYREQCLSVLHVINMDLKRMSEYPLDFQDEISELESVKKEVEQKIKDYDNIYQTISKTNSELTMEMKLIDDELEELRQMKGITK